MNFDATVRFDDGTILNVFVNSSGDLESFFYKDQDHLDDEDYCDGSIHENLSPTFTYYIGLEDAVRIACEMSDFHNGYEKRPYTIM